MSNIVAIVGRPNVGKSTFFNRMTESRDAIVDEVSGVTRDRHYGSAEWNGKVFTLIDTGGYVAGSDDVFEKAIRVQVTAALEEADAVIFMVDVTSGITVADELVAGLLRKASKKVFVAVNKVDNSARIAEAAEFYALGLGEYHCISSVNGSGTGELLDALAASLKDTPADDGSGLPKFAVVGRPNVGKSSLINALLGRERHIVTDVPGTTRDAIDTRYTLYSHDFILVDTAGLRKKGKVHENIEFYSVMRTVRAVEKCDVCLLLIDATQGLEAQDVNIFRLARRNGKGIVVLVNKWDLVEKQTGTAKEYAERIQAKVQPFTDIPVLFISALTKQRIHDAVQAAVDVYARRSRRIPTSKLNEAMLPAVEHYSPPSVRGRFIKIKYVTQLPGRTPVFAFFCNYPQDVREPYKRYLENKLRESFDLKGVPVNLLFKKK